MSGIKSKGELKSGANYLQDSYVRSFSMIQIKRSTISLFLLLVVNEVKMVFQVSNFSHC